MKRGYLHRGKSQLKRSFIKRKPPKKRKKKDPKKVLRAEADRLWHLAGIEKWGSTCFFNGSPKSAEHHTSIAHHGHHFFPKGQYPQLRYDLDNCVPICWPDHFKLENIDHSMVADIIAERGNEWYKSLLEKTKELKPGFQTIDYYRQMIEILK